MKFYPNYFEMELDKTAIPRPRKDRLTYGHYMNSLVRKWCLENHIVYNNLIASFFSAILQGKIKVEYKNPDRLIAISNGKRIDRVTSTHTPADFLYNLYNEYNFPLTDYSEMEFMLAYKEYLLSKLGNIKRRKRRRN